MYRRTRNRTVKGYTVYEEPAARRRAKPYCAVSGLDELDESLHSAWRNPYGRRNILMSLAAWRGILIPFLGTSLGASSVFFLGKSPHPLIQRGLTGFAAGVMVAASV